VVDSSLVEALGAHTLALDGVDPNSLGWLGDRLADAEVVGLGEATHGTREFVQFKRRLLRHLVAETGLRALCIEAGFAETLALDRYVTEGEGTAAESLASLRGWPWETAEMRSVIEWLREFNAGRPRAERVRLYGLDAQYTDAAVGELREFLRRVDQPYADSIREDLDTLDDGGTLLARSPVLDGRVETAQRLLPDLRQRLERNRERYAAALSAERVRVARACVEQIDRALSYKQALQARQRGSGKASARCLRRRDEAMAATVAWVREHHPQVALWAHDAHLNRSGQVAEEGDVVPSLGSRLAARHGDSYLAVGFAFGRGEFRAIREIVEPSEPRHVRRLETHRREEPEADSIEAVLAALDKPVAVVDLRGAREDPRLADWLDRPRAHFSAGVTYDEARSAGREYVYSEAFDALCYVDRTTPTRPL